MGAVQPETLTPLGIAALALLQEGPRHPYDMFQLMIQRHEDRIVKIRPGTLYHAIGKLAEAGLVEEIGTDREGNRPERTTYRITATGDEVLRAAVAERLAQPRQEYPVFPQAVAEAHNLPAAEVVEHLRHRAALLEREISIVHTMHRQLLDAGKPAPYLLDVDLFVHTLRAELDWVTATAAAIESGRLEWTSP